NEPDAEMLALAERLRSKGLIIIEGDCLQIDCLRRCNVEEAKEIIITRNRTPLIAREKYDLIAARIASTIAGMNTKARIIVEIEDRKYVPFLRDLGVSEVRRPRPHLRLVWDSKSKGNV